MRPKLKLYRTGWITVMEKNGPLYSAIVRNAAGEIHDKVRCDDYRTASEYYRAFSAVARNGKAAP